MSHHALRLRRCGLLALTVAIASCGSGSPPTPVSPPPPVVKNLAPVIRSVELEHPRVEAGTSVKVVAVVEDAETPPEQLQYEWTASAGTFTGTGREVTWQAPADVTAALDVTFSLTVVESAVPVNRTTFAVPAPVRVHDSVRELTALVSGFLDDFTNDRVSADDCVRHFTDSCSGKASERRDVERVRTSFTMLDSSSYSIRSVTVTEPWSRAQMSARCDFVSREKATGIVGTSRGTCRLTAVYENNRWWLCDSHFDSLTTASAFSRLLR